MPSNTSFVRAVPPLHDIADINQLSRGDSIRLRQYKKFLMDYLSWCLDNRQQQAGYQLVSIALYCLVIMNYVPCVECCRVLLAMREHTSEHLLTFRL